nr:immunoglobulin heavy chain junction region [Macaca mulatta]
CAGDWQVGLDYW